MLLWRGRHQPPPGGGTSGHAQGLLGATVAQEHWTEMLRNCRIGRGEHACFSLMRHGGNQGAVAVLSSAGVAGWLTRQLLQQLLHSQLRWSFGFRWGQWHGICVSALFALSSSFLTMAACRCAAARAAATAHTGASGACWPICAGDPNAPVPVAPLRSTVSCSHQGLRCYSPEVVGDRCLSCSGLLNPRRRKLAFAYNTAGQQTCCRENKQP